MHRIAIAALFSVALCCAASAQINTDTCQLTVRVRTLQDREYDRPLQVELISTWRDADIGGANQWDRECRF